MEYSSFRYERVTSKEYEELSEIFLSLATSEEMKEKLISILHDGGYKGFGLASNITNRDNPGIEAYRRVSMAYLLIRNPETFDVIVNNNINLFHGTNGNVLPSIIKYGLRSGKETKESGMEVLSGEPSTRWNGERSFVSLTDVLDIACGYTTLPYRGEANQRLSFPVIVGMNSMDAKELGTCLIRSDVCEVGVKKLVPRDKIKLICVPSDKVKIVKRLVHDDNIIVSGIDDIDNKFYFIMEEFGNIEINYQKLKELRENLVKKKKKFTLEDIKSIVIKKEVSGYGR